MLSTTLPASQQRLYGSTRRSYGLAPRSTTALLRPRGQHPHRLQRSAAEDAVAAELASDQHQQRVVLRKPVGIVFAQNKDTQGKNGPVFVEEIVPGSNADKSGQIQVGDIVSRVSAVVLKAGKEGQYEKEGYGQRPYDNWETVLIDCEGREFKTVMNALKSNNERWGINNVTIVFRKPATSEEAQLCRKQQLQ